jgi:hypothetical protein
VDTVAPWIPPTDYDLYAERPNQLRWRSMVDAADQLERAKLLTSMCWVLGLPPTASDIEIFGTLVAERRTAEELAGLYIEARGDMEGWTS